MPPTLTLDDKDKIYKVCENEDVTFTIKMSGVPTPEAEWYNSKTILLPSPKCEQTFDEQSAMLTIKKVSNEDAGSYTIKLRNECGEAEANLTLIIMRKRHRTHHRIANNNNNNNNFPFLGKPSAPGAPEPVEITHDSVTLFWKQPEDDGNSEIIEYHLEYQEITKKTWTKITQITNTTYTVSKLQTNSEYVFRTVAINKVGPSPLSPTSSHIKITAPLTKEAPIIQEPLQDSTVGINQKHTLSCIVGGSPAPEIQWYRNDQIFTTRTMTYENRVAKYTIDATDASTESTYKCVAVNEMGTAETQCRLTVQDKPSIVVDEQLLVQKLRTNGTWTVDGQITGFPAPQITWYRNGVRIEAANRLSIRSDTIATSTIEINGLERSDSGKYTIEAKNKAGLVSVELQLNVIDKPDRPEAIAVLDVKKDSVVIEWRPPTDDGGLEITKYTIEKSDPDNIVWIKVAEVERSIESYCVQKLLPNAQYIFRIMAMNPIGASEPIESEPVMIRVKVEPPTAPRMPTEISGMTDTSLTLAWQVPEKDGGSKILEYIVEMKATDTKEEWRKCGMSAGDCTNLFVEKLVKETSYEFRISARNSAGTGPALVTVDKIIAGRKISKCPRQSAFLINFILLTKNVWPKFILPKLFWPNAQLADDFSNVCIQFCA